MIDPFDNKDYKNKEVFKSIKPADINQGSYKFMMKGGSLISNAALWNGDIIEVCPCKEISGDSPDHDSLCFVVPGEDGKDVKIIPLGYALYYHKKSPKQPYNCDYVYDKDLKSLTIRAVAPIKPGDKLILNY